MSEYFNLLSLHKPYDSHPRSWICVSGRGVWEIISHMEEKIKNERNVTREALAREIASKLNVSHNIIKNILRGAVYYYPIAVINEVAKSCKNGDSLLSRIEDCIEYLKVNSADSTPVRAVRTLDSNLSKIIGAFMADGNLSYRVVIASKIAAELNKAAMKLRKLGIRADVMYSKARGEHYVNFFPNYSNFDKCNKIIGILRQQYSIQTNMTIELTDYHKSNVDAFNGWMKTCFGIPPTRFNRKKNAWRTAFSNKILARYFICFFGIKSGYKTDIAFEPDVINKSSLAIRRAFAMGVIMFDGSAKMEGTIAFETKSRRLFDSICDIFEKEKMCFNSHRTRVGFAISTSKENAPEKQFKFFEVGTSKWLRLKEVYGASQDKSGFEERYPFQPNSKLTMSGIKQTLAEVKCCDIEFLMAKYGCKHTTVVNYINILKNNGKLIISNTPKSFNFKSISATTSVLLNTQFHEIVFSRIAKTFGEYQEAAEYFGVHKSTISAWKLRKNRVPLSMLVKICLAVKLDISDTKGNIIETDRAIVETI